MPADSFSDLDALARKGDGILYRHPTGVWTYSGAPTADPRLVNVPYPLESVQDARLQAALRAGAWAVAVVDHTGPEHRPIGVRKAPADGSVIRPRTVAEFGAAACGGYPHERSARVLPGGFSFAG